MPVALTAFAAAATLLLATAAPAQQNPKDLAQMSLEDLMNIEVTSVSKKEQKVSKTASAVFVISAEDIARSGATHIPDLLRMVPGVEVAQINSDTWAISIRGFNGQYSNKLLVLIDGRTVYTSMFSGVYWNGQDVMLSDIDRIEVIRGPGATLWGANAVNGVINIITRNAAATQGGLITAGGGTYEHGFGAARYGGQKGSAAYRVFATGSNRNHLPNALGLPANDDWNMVHGGFRTDITASAQDSLLIEGDAHRGDAGEIISGIRSLSPPLNGFFALRDYYSGWDVLSRWNHAVSPRSETSLQVYFDRIVRNDTTYGLAVNTFDLDFQHHVAWGARQDIVWGLGYRLNSDSTPATPRIYFTPPARNTNLFSWYVQDEIALQPDRLSLTLGTRVEHDDYTGFGLQPNLRIAWTPDDRNSFWAAVSRSERTPARADASIHASFAVVPGPNNLPVLLGYAGNPRQQAEKETSVEAGYRAKVSDKLSLDATAFFNHYDHLTSVEPGSAQFVTDPPPPHVTMLSSFANLAHGETHGFEAFADWRVTGRWSLSPGYAFLSTHLHRDPGGLDYVTLPTYEAGSPHHQAQLGSHLRLPRNLSWNAAGYFVGRLPLQGPASYTRLDSSLTWQVRENFSVSLVGQNLLRDRHLEFNGPSRTVEPSLIKRSVYFRAAWSF